MLNAIIDWSLRHRLAVVGLSLAAMVAGLLALRHLDIDAFPDTTPVQVQVNTVARETLACLAMSSTVVFEIPDRSKHASAASSRRSLAVSGSFGASAPHRRDAFVTVSSMSQDRAPGPLEARSSPIHDVIHVLVRPPCEPGSARLRLSLHDVT